MENENILKKIEILKSKLIKEGFIIDGIFGSVLRSKNFNDIDLLYHLDDKFFSQNRGYRGFKKLEEIKGFLQNHLGKKIDLAPIDNLSRTGKKYILKDVIYV